MSRSTQQSPDGGVDGPLSSGAVEPKIEISLNAVLVAVTDDTPRVLTVEGPDGRAALPSGPLEPEDPTLERALRRWVGEQTGLDVGYVEQLYTFGDQNRSAMEVSGRELSIAYLALVREEEASGVASWQDVYDFLPWEDHRQGVPPVVSQHLLAGLRSFVEADPQRRLEREDRVRIVFGADVMRPLVGEVAFDGVRALERFELLYEAGLLTESDPPQLPDVSRPMAFDHRRMTATAVGRLRGKLTYRPLVFELLGDRFTLLQLQKVVEALAGVRLHKQNFRRLVEAGGLVEGSGELAQTAGRPAELFQFRREVLRERPRPGLGSPWS